MKENEVRDNNDMSSKLKSKGKDVVKDTKPVICTALEREIVGFMLRRMIFRRGNRDALEGDIIALLALLLSEKNTSELKALEKNAVYLFADALIANAKGRQLPHIEALEREVVPFLSHMARIRKICQTGLPSINWW